MKNKIFSLFFIVVISLSLVSSVEISMKESVKLGEGFIIQISGNFIEPLTKANVQFYRRHMKTSIEPYELKYIEGSYYLSFIPLDKIPDNYSIVLDDIKYMVGMQRLETPVSKEFRILSEKVPFSINPPLKIADDQYSIEIINLMQTSLEIDLQKKEKLISDMNVTGEPVEANGFFDILFGLFDGDFENYSSEDSLGSSEKIYLQSGEVKTITYPKPQNEGFQMLEFFYENEAYGAMIYTPKTIETAEEDEPVQENDSVDESDEAVNETEDEEDESFWDSLNDLFSGNKTDEEPVQNSSNITYLDNGTIIVDGVVFEDFVENESTSNNTDSNEEIVTTDEGIKTCEAIGGKVCTPNEEVCEGETKYSKSAVCCLGECVKVEKSSTGKTVGWALIIAITLFVTWFLKKKYMKAKPKNPNLLEIGKKK